MSLPAASVRRPIFTTMVTLMVVILGMIFLLGFFLDWIEISLIILPLVAPVVQARGAEGRIFLASAITEPELRAVLAPHIRTEERLAWDAGTETVAARERVVSSFFFNSPK